ncbi:class I SAM-dependent methyltransferase [Enterobacteriaceae bacterium H11S18]|uniref:class I SAM-dependent methyltransferase n=1 Tax=Dryocola clanedunensis TaxID=2925396 RepID=UPI0022F0E142|nr:class I SAM-dependent methyltransferase [Dryocola clanedunensis]MCT4709199.1 class I SAM-dependent methyltransferase [Dryocola clanedunensis]
MNTALKQRIDLMRAKIEGRAPVVEVHASTQLFVSPEPVSARLVSLAGVTNDDVILEPSAGTGAILRAILATAPDAQCDAVELNAVLWQHLRKAFETVAVTGCDFLHYMPEKRYSKIIMNPPFRNGLDIKHIQHALGLLKPGGVLTAVCLGGPRQEKAFRDSADVWEPLPRGTFAYTDVSTVIVRIVAD